MQRPAIDWDPMKKLLYASGYGRWAKPFPSNHRHEESNSVCLEFPVSHNGL
jgi:hypothetical protein